MSSTTFLFMTMEKLAGYSGTIAAEETQREAISICAAMTTLTAIVCYSPANCIALAFK